jgi:signal transduction histidine kinase
MYGDRDDPVTVIGELGRQLEHAAAPGESLATLVETIGRSLKLPYVAITTRDGDTEQTVAASGIAPSGLIRLPLIYQSQQVGELLVAPRAPGESFSVAERRLLDNIARQAGAAVYAAKLTDHLQRSREQLVLAREEERRRLQRDLHDGLGPQLAALSMQLDVARRLTAEDSPDAADLLGRLSADTQTAIADIRRLVYDLRPPALDQLGLVGAVREFAAGHGDGYGPRLMVDAPQSLPPLPAAVEVAAYRIVQEAVTNCLRHAEAHTCRILLHINGGLQVEVIDDGRGLPPAAVSGVGLASMQERAAELGGQCHIESTPGGGTQVVAIFPLPPESHP